MRDESGDLGWRLEGHHENNGAQLVNGCSQVAQLREMLSARQSTQPAQEDQNHRLTPPRREGNGFPVVVPKRQSRSLWQRVRHTIYPLTRAHRRALPLRAATEGATSLACQRPVRRREPKTRAPSPRAIRPELGVERSPKQLLVRPVLPSSSPPRLAQNSGPLAASTPPRYKLDI